MPRERVHLKLGVTDKLTRNVGVLGAGLPYRKRLDLPEFEAANQQVETELQRSGASSSLLLLVVMVVGIFIDPSIRLETGSRTSVLAAPIRLEKA